MAVGEVGEDRAHFSCTPPAFSVFGRGSGKVGLKGHHTPASLYSREETEAPRWGVTVWGITGRPEKIKKKRGRWKFPVPVVE